MALAVTTRSHLSVLRALVALAAVVLYFSGAVADARVLLTLDDFGAVGDGIANDTQAFVNAWTAACGSEQQAVLAVPAAKAYRIWPVQLAGPCKKKLKLLIAGTIVAPASPDEWAGRDPMKWLYIYGVDGLSVSGGGTIDGAGQEWWARSCKRKKTQPCDTRSPPRAVHFEECRGVSVQGVTLQNGQQFHLSFTRCRDVKANFLRVVAPADSPNTDGIHLNDTSHVQIMDNLISTGDDCVSMVGNCSDIRVRDISCGPGHGISIGSLGKNRTTDRIENVRVDTCLLTNTTNGVRIKSWQGGMGFAHDLRFESVVMKNVSNPIIIDQYYCDQPTPCANQTEAVEVRKVEFVDVRGTSATAQAIKIACSDAVPCRELELRNVNLTLEGGFSFSLEPEAPSFYSHTQLRSSAGFCSSGEAAHTDCDQVQKIMDNGATPATNHRRHVPLQEAGGELVELLWQDGAVVAQAQAQTPHRRCSQSVGASGLTGGGDAAAWLIPDDGGGGCGSGRDLYSQLWHGIADADAHGGAGAGSSFCGSNAVTAPALLPSPEEEPGSSSAGGHAVLFKRGRNEIECRGEDADECEAVDETRPSKRPTAKRRTRAADVHNLSERRRRDRINEKMKALQELVPHCNKSDKASILDDTIEYLKSLQLQLQIMWMTTGMAPMMFPGAHRLMPPMAMGLNPGCMPPAQSLSQLQRVAPFMNNPLPNQMSQVRSPVTSSPNVTNQMQINGICEPRNPFLDPNDTLAAAAAAQVPGMFPYGSQPVEHNEAHELLASTATPATGARPPCSSDRTGT